MLKQVVKYSLTLCLMAGVTLAQAQSQSAETMAPLVTDTGAGKTIMVIAHRGEHLQHPENTLPAFQAAYAAGAEFIEADVQTTSDGKLVIMHDGTVNRTTESTGAIQDKTFDQMRALDAGVKFSPEFKGTKVPTFDEVLDFAEGKMNVYVDTKHADPQVLVDAIVRHDMQNHVVIYGNPFFLYEVHKIRPDLKVMPEADNLGVCKMLIKDIQVKVLAFGAGDFNPDVIACAKNAGVQIYVDRMGATDNPAGWQWAIDMGADGIQTNRPAELADYLRAHHMWAAPVEP